MDIPYSKYKKIFVTGQLELTREQMAKYKESCENTFNMDWDRLAPSGQENVLISKMSFKQDDMDLIIEDIKKIAKECPFLNFKADFSHDYYDPEYMDDVYDRHICTIHVNDGKVVVD